MERSVEEAITGVYTTKSLCGDYVSISVKKGADIKTYRIDPLSKEVSPPVPKIEDPVVLALLAGRNVNEILTYYPFVKIDGAKAAQR